MPLKITLKPREKMIIGKAVIRNGNSSCNLIFENKTMILREKDVLKEEHADSPAKRIYYAIQLMYLDQENVGKYHVSYCSLARDFLNASPSAFGLIREISEKIFIGEHYSALKLAKKLIDYEDFVIYWSGAEVAQL